MPKPVVTVVLPVHNNQHDVRCAVESIIGQTYANWELVIVDDASSDATPRIVHAFKDARIKVLTNSRQLGLAASLNRAITAARGAYIARMDADDVAFPSRIEKQVAALESNPAIALVSSAVLVMNKEKVHTGVWRPDGTRPGQLKCLQGRVPYYHPTWVGRAEWFKSHPYDEHFTKAQDFELLVRTMQEYQFMVLPEVLLGYQQGTVRLRKRWLTRIFVFRAIVKNRARFSVPGAVLLAAIFMLINGALDVGRQLLGSPLDPAASTLLSEQERRAWDELSKTRAD